MTLTIIRQEKFSRLQLLLRTLLGWLYIVIPHAFLLLFLGIWAMVLMLIAWFAVLFTGKYPKGMFDYMVKLMNWETRLNAVLYNLVDGYPALGMNGSCSAVTLDIPYPEKLSRGLLLLRTFLGWLYLGIPHMFCLYFRAIGSAVLMLLAWFAVLITGKYPEKWHAFNTGTLRWGIRLNLYMMFMTDEYPPFSGK